MSSAGNNVINHIEQNCQLDDCTTAPASPSSGTTTTRKAGLCVSTDNSDSVLHPLPRDWRQVSVLGNGLQRLLGQIVGLDLKLGTELSTTRHVNTCMTTVVCLDKNIAIESGN